MSLRSGNVYVDTSHAGVFCFLLLYTAIIVSIYSLPSFAALPSLKVLCQTPSNSADGIWVYCSHAWVQGGVLETSQGHDVRSKLPQEFDWNGCRWHHVHTGSDLKTSFYFLPLWSELEREGFRVEYYRLRQLVKPLAYKRFCSCFNHEVLLPFLFTSFMWQLLVSVFIWVIVVDENGDFMK